jgi:uncharacterized protein (DUF58 family)
VTRWSWWPFLVLVFLLGILTKVYALAAFAAMLAVISGLAMWWRGRSLFYVNYRRRLHYKRAFPGELVPLRLEVENRKFLPLSWLRVEDPFPFAVGTVDEGLLMPTHNPEVGLLVNLFSLRWFERTYRAYTLQFRKRGVYLLGPARLESGDIFGLFEKVNDDGPTDLLTVFPEPLPFNSLQLPADDPFGDRRARRRLYEDLNQPTGVRDYHPEDDFRRMHWPATAHTGQLQVKVFQPASAQVMMVCLNVSTLAHYWEGILPALLEHLIRTAAAVVQQGLQDGYRVGLVSNGCLAHADQPFRVPPGRSPGQLAHLLSTLAGVTPLVTGSFDRFLISEGPRLPYGATLVVITGLMSPELAETLLRLRQHGRRITLLDFSREAPPAIQGVNVVHLPYIEEVRRK